jgi:hypothetical protein
MEEMVDEQWNIFFPLSEGREMERDNAQPIKKIFPEFTFFDTIGQIFMGSGKNRP